MNEELLDRIKQLIEHHETWSKRDFSYTQYIFWIAVLSSFSATVFVGIDVIPKVFIAIVAGLPALTLVLDKIFRYRERALWHQQYAATLRNLCDEFMIAELPATDIVEQLAKLRTDMNGCWPGENTSAIPQAPETNN